MKIVFALIKGMSWLRRKRAAFYGTYEVPQRVPGNPTDSVQWPVDPVNQITRCKDYCSRLGYRVYFTYIAFERKVETVQGESREFRHLLQIIEDGGLDLVLFVDFAWISRKPEQMQRLLSSAQTHHTTLIDVDSQHIIFQPL